MNPYLHANKFSIKGLGFVVVLMLLLVGEVAGQAIVTNNWKGLSDDWYNINNWSLGTVPNEYHDVIIKDGIGPRMLIWNEEKVNSLTIGGGASPIKFFLSCTKFTVKGNVEVKTGGTFENNGTITDYKGNFIVDGTYMESMYAENRGANTGGKYKPESEFSGVSEIRLSNLSDGTPQGFGTMTISGQVTLKSNLRIIVSVFFRPGNSSDVVEDPILTIKGTGILNPDIYKVSFQTLKPAPKEKVLSPSFIAESKGVIMVKAATFSENYDRFFTAYSPTSVVDYAATNIDQTIDKAHLYPIIQISGSQIKSLEGDTKVFAGSLDTEVRVIGGTLDLKNFTLNRNGVSITATGVLPINTTVTGGKLTVANQAFLKLSGTNNFPTGFNIVGLEPLSTVEYYGTDQSVSTRAYGILRISGSSGTKSLLANTAIQNEVQVISSTLDIKNFTLNRDSQGGRFFVADNAFLKLNGTSNFPNNFIYDLRPVSTVEYYGTVAQTVKRVQYGHLTFSQSGRKTFETGQTFISGNFTVPNSTSVLLPVTTSTTINYNGNGAQEVAAISYDNLSFTVNGKKTITSGRSELNVINALVLQTAGGVNSLNDGIIEVLTINATSVNKPIILNTATGTISERSNAYVTGTVEKTLTTVAANLTSTFGGIGINVTPNTTHNNVKVIRTTGVTARVGTGQNVHRLFYVIPEGNIQDIRASITLDYFGHELNQNVEADLVAYWSNVLNSNWWRPIDPIAPRTAGQITVNNSGNLSPWGYFTLGSRVRPLPVELISFSAAKRGTDAVLNWAVASEENNKGFEIEASTDGRTFDKIGFVESKVVNTSIRQDYSFTDARKGKHGVVYYRLKQIDLDGKTSIYGPIDVNFGVVKTTSIAAHPNPIKDNLVVALASHQAGEAKMMVHDMMGKVWLTQNQLIETATPIQDVNLNVEKFPTGIYILTVELNSQVQTFKLIKN